MTLAVESADVRLVDVVDDVCVDDMLVTVDSSATASQKLVAVWLPFFKFFAKSLNFRVLCALGDVCILVGFPI